MIVPAKILLPNPSIDMTRWAVVACDQYTAQPEYWTDADALVGDAPSTLRLIYPEVYLDDNDPSRIQQIHQTMRDYLENDVFAPAWEGFVLVERMTERGRRLGLVLAVDLEAYDFVPGSKSMIRATEGTILERIPPRVRIRQNAPLELPHVMLLVDDPSKTLIEPLYEVRDTLRPLYDTPLMLGGGHIRGWAVERDRLQAFADVFGALQTPGGIRIAVGDGNHSLATARTCWLAIRDGLSDEERSIHPARYALAELCNLYDPGIEFEPIHRILYGVDAAKIRTAFETWLKARDATIVEGEQLRIVAGMEDQPIAIQNPPYTLPVATLQSFLDEWLPKDARIDYIHGDDVLRGLAVLPGRCGFLLPPMPKESLFPAIAQEGVLPRKTFSMGHASEKRYYMECRRI